MLHFPNWKFAKTVSRQPTRSHAHTNTQNFTANSSFSFFYGGQDQGSVSFSTDPDPFLRILQCGPVLPQICTKWNVQYLWNEITVSNKCLELIESMNNDCPLLQYVSKYLYRFFSYSWLTLPFLFLENIWTAKWNIILSNTLSNCLESKKFIGIWSLFSLNTARMWSKMGNLNSWMHLYNSEPAARQYRKKNPNQEYLHFAQPLMSNHRASYTKKL